MTENGFVAICERSTCVTPQGDHNVIVNGLHSNPTTGCPAFIVPLVPDCGGDRIGRSERDVEVAGRHRRVEERPVKETQLSGTDSVDQSEV